METYQQGTNVRVYDDQELLIIARLYGPDRIYIPAHKRAKEIHSLLWQEHKDRDLVTPAHDEDTARSYAQLYPYEHHRITWDKEGWVYEWLWTAPPDPDIIRV